MMMMMAESRLLLLQLLIFIVTTATVTTGSRSQASAQKYSSFIQLILFLPKMRPAITIAVTNHFITRKSSYCFQCVLAIAILSVRHTGRSVKSGAS